MVYVVMTCELMLYVLMAYVNEYGLYTYGQYRIAMATHIIAAIMHACAHARTHARTHTAAGCEPSGCAFSLMPCTNTCAWH